MLEDHHQLKETTTLMSQSEKITANRLKILSHKCLSADIKQTEDSVTGQSTWHLNESVYKFWYDFSDKSATQNNPSAFLSNKPNVS